MRTGDSGSGASASCVSSGSVGRERGREYWNTHVCGRACAAAEGGLLRRRVESHAAALRGVVEAFGSGRLGLPRRAEQMFWGRVGGARVLVIPAGGGPGVSVGVWAASVGPWRRPGGGCRDRCWSSTEAV